MRAALVLAALLFAGCGPELEEPEQTVHRFVPPPLPIVLQDAGVPDAGP